MRVPQGRGPRKLRRMPLLGCVPIRTRWGEHVATCKALSALKALPAQPPITNFITRDTKAEAARAARIIEAKMDAVWATAAAIVALNGGAAAVDRMRGPIAQLIAVCDGDPPSDTTVTKKGGVMDTAVACIKAEAKALLESAQHVSLMF